MISKIIFIKFTNQQTMSKQLKRIFKNDFKTK
ncbi:hypothetical protein SCLAR_v1c12200 [Spiroplasma clarkii]|uniref:Uncharacterized protein n=1 Tax=Spiroplasma clarkii TaxID=2139 RepID=A0A2K8KIK8_9MOLU|nr:hypothetical protein SCLAR_v1c12200 [Spiroplasma clarkii]